MKQLTLDTVVEISHKGQKNRFALNELYSEERYGDVEDFLTLMDKWQQAGRLFVVENKSPEEEMADQIANELMAVRKAKTIQQDRVDRETYSDNSNGTYKMVAFPAKTLLEAQEMHQMLMRNFNIKDSQLGMNMQGGNIEVTITECPVKTYLKLQKSFGIRKATEAVANTVTKTANTVVNGTDMAINNLVTPVAKTAIGTGAKIAKTLFGFGAKIGGIAVSELTKASKECINEIKTDGHIAEAKGEVIDGYHSVKRAFGNKGIGSNMAGGRIVS